MTGNSPRKWKGDSNTARLPTTTHGSAPDAAATPHDAAHRMNDFLAGRAVARLGLIADTHGFLDRRVFSLFEGVDAILHAGDIGSPGLIPELEGIAPVTAVLGNNDAGLDFHLTEVMEAAGHRFLVHHIVNPAAPAESIGDRFRRSSPGVVVFGHTHQAFHETRNGIVLINPGYSGRPRFKLERSVAIATAGPEGIAVEFIPLQDVNGRAG